jgi:hypothetical protein
MRNNNIETYEVSNRWKFTYSCSMVDSYEDGFPHIDRTATSSTEYSLDARCPPICWRCKPECHGTASTGTSLYSHVSAPVPCLARPAGISAASSKGSGELLITLLYPVEGFHDFGCFVGASNKLYASF